MTDGPLWLFQANAEWTETQLTPHTPDVGVDVEGRPYTFRHVFHAPDWDSAKGQIDALLGFDRPTPPAPPPSYAHIQPADSLERYGTGFPGEVLEAHMERAQNVIDATTEHSPVMPLQDRIAFALADVAREESDKQRRQRRARVALLDHLTGGKRLALIVLNPAIRKDWPTSTLTAEAQIEPLGPWGILADFLQPPDENGQVLAWVRFLSADKPGDAEVFDLTLGATNVGTCYLNP